ncbi:MAG TPA: hypothetical protein VGF99_11135 [Myxococcota bacterium]
MRSLTTLSKVPFTPTFSASLAAFALALGGSACTITNDEDNDGDGTPDVQETGTVNSALTSGNADDNRGIAGRAAIDTSTKAELARYEDDGTTTTVEEADVDANGRFSFAAVGEDDLYVISTFDAEGALVGQALLERGPADDETVTSQPVGTESSVEALIYAQLRADGAGRDDIDVTDLRNRVDLASALVIAGVADGANDAAAVGTHVAIAASAMLTAQYAYADYYAQEGIDATLVARAHADAYLQANEALYNGEAAQETLDAAAAAVVSADVALGVSEWDSARLSSEASANVRAVLDARDDVNDDLRTAMARASAVVEARLVAQAFVAIVSEGDNRAQDDIDEANEIAADLRADVAAAVSVEQLRVAFDEFRDDVRGDADAGVEADDSIIGLLDIDGSNVAELAAALLVVVEVGDDLEDRVAVAAEAAVSTGNSVDEEALADDIRDAYASFRADLEASINASFDVNEADVALMTRVLVISEGSFR